MGNFEKLGILVIIVLVVVIIVVAAWGVRSDPTEAPLVATNQESDRTEDDVVREMLLRFEVDEATLRRDVTRVIEDLVKLRLLTV